MGHVVLLGDSILDNGAYTGRDPAVIRQLKGALPAGWEATLCAVDGATTEDVGRQFGRIPADATHLVLSIGGNDALGRQDLLELQNLSGAEVLLALADAADAFGRGYRAAVDALRDTGLPLVLCTIYDANLGEPVFERVAITALAVFNDVILRTAFRHGLPVIDLRFVCSERADYANPIEPSAVGGAKIVAAILGELGLARDPKGAQVGSTVRIG